MQAGLVLARDGSQPLGRGGVETRFETMSSRFRGKGAREIQPPFVKGRLGLAGQNVSPIATVHGAIRSSEIGFLASSGFREIAIEWTEILATQQRAQFLHNNPDGSAIAHRVMQCHPEQMLAGFHHFDQPSPPQRGLAHDEWLTLALPDEGAGGG